MLTSSSSSITTSRTSTRHGIRHDVELVVAMLLRPAECACGARDHVHARIAAQVAA